VTPEEYQEWIQHPLTQKALKEVNEEYNTHVENMAKGGLIAGTIENTGGNYSHKAGYLKGLLFITARLHTVIKQKNKGSCDDE